MATIVLGGQFGDEGKGKLVDLLSSSYGLCARAAGGDNAGHTVIAAGKTYDFHLIPSSLLTPTTVNVIGSGCVVHVPSFFKELEALEKKGLDARERLFISDRAHVVFDVHQLVDGLEEAELGKGGGHAVGTTKRGIGPCYSQKAARSGVRVGEVFNKGTLDRKLRATAAGFQKRYGDLLTGYEVEDEIRRYDTELRERLRPFVIDQIPLIQSAPKLLVEGANALLLDVDYGTYPMVTSSNTGIGGVFTGLAISPFKIQDIIGVVKAYMSRVGNGPFPSEQSDNEIGEKLQSVGHEYGVTTGRKRRCGWLDLVAVRHSAAVNHYTAINLTKLDILDTFEEIKVATAYRLNGELLPSFPADLDTLSAVEVVYETLPGWNEATTGAKSFDQLPANARKYVEYIEKDVGAKIRYIGTGPGRESMITR